MTDYDYEFPEDHKRDGWREGPQTKTQPAKEWIDLIRQNLDNIGGNK